MQHLPILHDATIALLKKGKNLLAFSGGVDSSALFFILHAYGIAFDVAIVDYNIREQSKQEVVYAKTLCTEYDKKLFFHDCALDHANFENNARIERYNFFEKIIEKNAYVNLITAHHLNDKLEWFLMQLSKGSGLVELLGFDEIEAREDYNILRPLSHVSKKELENFLAENKISHFIDESNRSEKYTRNKIRHHYSNAFVEEFQSGLSKSFEYLKSDAALLSGQKVVRIKNLYICKREPEELKNIRQIDKILKKLGVLMSRAQREEVLKTKNCVVSHKVAVAFSDDTIFIAPFIKQDMPKKFKEIYRTKNIPPKVRPYIYSEEIDTAILSQLIYKLLS